MRETDGLDFERNVGEGTATAKVAPLYLTDPDTPNTIGATIRNNMFVNPYSFISSVDDGFRLENDPAASTSIVDGNIMMGFGASFANYQGPAEYSNNVSMNFALGAPQGAIELYDGSGPVHNNILVIVPENATSSAQDICIFAYKFRSGTELHADHNTCIGQAPGDAGIQGGENGFESHQDYITSSLIVNEGFGIVSDTMVSDAWAVSTQGFNGAAVHHNDVYNSSIPYFKLHVPAPGFDNGVITHPSVFYGDLDVNPNFYDVTRRPATWDASLGGPGTYADITRQFSYRSGFGGTYNPAFNVQAALAYLQLGFTPANPALKGAAADGGDVGAVPVLSTLGSPTLSSLSCTPALISGASSATCTVTLSGPALAATTVALTSSATALVVPQSVTVPAGFAIAGFTAVSDGSLNTTATVTATVGGISTSFILSLTAPPPTLTALSCTPTSISGASSTICTVTLSGPALAATIVALSSSTTALVVPQSITVAAGSATAGFTAVSDGSVNTTATLTATVSGISKSVTLTLTVPPPTLTALSCTPASISGASSTTCTVTLSGPALAATTVALTSSATALVAPQSVTVTAGLATAGFTAVSDGSVNTTATLTATVSGISKSVTLTLTVPPPTLSALSCTPTSISGASSTTCTVTLSGPTVAATAVVLSSSTTALVAPQSVTVPAGFATAGFTAVSDGSVNTTATLTATVSGISKSFTLTLTVPPPTLTALSCTPTSISGASSTTCTVTLSGPAIAATAVVLSSSTTALVVPQSVTVPLGFSSAGFTAVSDGSVNTTATLTATVTGISKSFTLTLTVPPPTLTALSCTPTSISGASSTTCTVTLSGPTAAPTAVALTSNSAAIVLPQSVTVPAGFASAGFAAVSSGSSNATAALSAALGGISKTFNLALTTGTFSLRIHAGGGAYVDAQGYTWSADAGYTGGAPWSTANPIVNTNAAPLYQSARWGSFSYLFPVPNGQYTVNLKFAEISLNAIGQRIFSVALNGAMVLQNFDVVAAAEGPLTPVDKAFPVTVTNGQIQIAFLQGAANAPLVNAIEIVQAGVPLSTTATPPASFSPLYINSGGAPLQDTQGNLWAADTDFGGGTPWSATNGIGNTTAPQLYQTCRYGAFYYQVPLPNGQYTVTLKFAEIARSGAGQRVFNVQINGAPALVNFDIVAAAGAPFISLDKTFQVTVNNGALTLGFTPGTADWPLINAISIVQATGGN